MAGYNKFALAVSKIKQAVRLLKERIGLLNHLIEAANTVEATLLAKRAIAADILSQTDQQGMVFIE